jgi:hypothetical protein
MIAQRTAGLIAAQLDVEGRDLYLPLSQIFGQDAADLAIADEADIPLPGIARSGGHDFDAFKGGRVSSSREAQATTRSRASVELDWIASHSLAMTVEL